MVGAFCGAVAWGMAGAFLGEVGSCLAWIWQALAHHRPRPAPKASPDNPAPDLDPAPLILWAGEEQAIAASCPAPAVGRT